MRKQKPTSWRSVSDLPGYENRTNADGNLETRPIQPHTQEEMLVELKELAEPLVKWLNKSFNPHYEVRISQDGVQLLQIEMSNTFNGEFIRD